MMTRREYAASLTPPLAIAGARGRLSAAAKEAIAKAEDGGMRFTDTHYDAVVKPRKEGTLAPAPKREHKPKTVAEGGVAEPFQGDVMLTGMYKGFKVGANQRQGCLDSPGSIAGCQHRTHRTITARYLDGPKRGRMVGDEVTVAYQTEGEK